MDMIEQCSCVKLMEPSSATEEDGHTHREVQVPEVTTVAFDFIPGIAIDTHIIPSRQPHYPKRLPRLFLRGVGE